MGWSTPGLSRRLRTQSRRDRNQARLQAQFGPFTDDERIVTLMTVLSVAHGPVRELAGATLAEGTHPHAPHLAVGDAATRFPCGPTTLVLSEFSLVATDLDPLTGQASAVLARYDLSEISGLHAPGLGTSALLSFTDGGAVTLRGLAGVAKHTRQFYAEVAEHLAARR